MKRKMRVSKDQVFKNGSKAIMLGCNTYFYNSKGPSISPESELIFGSFNLMIYKEEATEKFCFPFDS